MGLFSDSIIVRARELFAELEALDIPERVEAINGIRLELHKLSPFKAEPVDCVVWVESDKVTANDYNPNSVAPPEMKLLERSIEADGYTQPIVSWQRDEFYEVVDGFHRNRVGKESRPVRKRTLGYLPLTVINDDRRERGDRIASTIRHNRARGKHKVEAMSDIVIELKRRNWTDERISRDLGMDQDEILRLCQITGLAEMFSDRQFSASWDVEGEVVEEDFQELTDDVTLYGEEAAAFRTVNTSDENRIKKDLWIRDKPERHTGVSDYPFALPQMEFEEFIVLFGQWYGQGKKTAGFIGIRAQESLHRYCAVATWEKKDLMLDGHRWTTKIVDQVYNVYPIYDWRTEDIWIYHAKFPHKQHNQIYDKMQMAGVPLSQQRLCQPFGDDQRRGLWLYHILEPHTWFKLVSRVNGANSGALYVEECGNITGYHKITKPPQHTWRSFCNLLLQTMPQKTRAHYVYRFKKFIKGWNDRGYAAIPEEAPPELEAKCWAPSWRRMCKVLLRNDYWCKGLGQTQPKSDAYGRYKQIMREKKVEAAASGGSTASGREG